MTGAVSDRVERLSLGARAPLPILAAVFLSSYLSWRPSMALMFTVSDALFLIGLCMLISRGRVPLEPMGWLSRLWLLSFLMMVGGLLVFSVGNAEPSRWVTVAAQYGFAWIVLSYAIMGSGRRYAISLGLALLGGMVAMELFGIIVYYSFQGTFESARETLGLDFISGARRLGVFATDANWNGAAIAMALPFVLYLRSSNFIGLGYALFASTVLLLALVLTASFTAFVSAVAGIGVYLLLGAVPLRSSFLVPIAAAILLVSQSGMTISSAFEKRVAGAIRDGDLREAGTYEGRLDLMSDAWSMVRQSPLTGIGVDQHRVVSQFKAPVHNIYLLLWVEGGIVAVLGWLGMLGVIAASVLDALRSDRRAGALAAAVLVTFFIFSGASPHMYARLWAVPVLVALAIATPQWQRRERGWRTAPAVAV